MKKLAVAGLGLLIILALVAPFVVGSVTESAWKDLDRELTRGSNGMASLETVQYDRGYLGADVLSRLILNIPEFEEPVELYLRSDIDHGLTGARAETRLDPERHAEWIARFEGEPPLLITNAGIGGTVKGTLAVSEMAQELAEGARVHSQPASLEFTLSDNAETVYLAFTWEGLTLEDSQSQIRVGEISFAEEMSHLAGELWTGELRVSVANLYSQLEDGSTVALQGLMLVGETRETEGDRLNSRLDLTVERIDADGEPYGDVSMALVAEDFDIEATNATLEAAQRLSEVEAGSDSEQAVQQLQLFGEFMTELRGLMSEGLSVGIPSVVVNTPDGRVELQLSFVHPELEPGQRNNMISLFQYSEGGLSLNMPSALLEKAPADLQQQIAMLHQQGLIQEVNGELSLDIELDRMTLIVNGHPIQIPPLI